MSKNNIPEIESRLSGAWNLVAMITQFGDADPVPNPGTTGMLTYNTNPTVRSVLADINKPGTVQDPAGLHFMYAGQYDLDQEAGTIVHNIEWERTTKLKPEQSGDPEAEQDPTANLKPMVRQFNLSADGQILEITGPGKRPNSKIAIIWEKVQQPAVDTVNIGDVANDVTAPTTLEDPGSAGPFCSGEAISY